MRPSVHSHAPLAAEARPRRGGDPLLGAIVGVIALIGVGVLFLASHDAPVAAAGSVSALNQAASDQGPGPQAP
jgi:hypothetical protein